jgi:hydrogenase large subunit
VKGTLREPLVRTPVREPEVNPVAVQYVVRCFDPCMVGAVH